ncbi:MAG: cutinase family protein [Mycobacterium sp.]|nr:cutinase family protein [Mycobacterium sp.]
MAGIMSTSSVGKAADGEPCPDVEVIFARGTLEPPGLGATGQAFADALTERLPGRSVDAYGVDYPASLDFSQAADGVVDASNKVEQTAASCPNTMVVVGGYSQGAAVAAYVTADSVPPGYALPAGITGPMPPNTARHVAAVVLFGKPSNGVVQLVDRNAPPITIGHLYAGKTIEMCAVDDPVCASDGFSRAAHSSYRFNGMTDQAAEFAVAKIDGGR